jgi:hypothetical protein
MPVVSQAQNRMMQAIAHGAKPRSGKGPSRKVAQEFVKASRGMKMRDLPKRVKSRAPKR